MNTCFQIWGDLGLATASSGYLAGGSYFGQGYLFFRKFRGGLVGADRVAAVVSGVALWAATPGGLLRAVDPQCACMV